MTWNKSVFDTSCYQEEAGHDCSSLDFESSQNPEQMAVPVLFLPAAPTSFCCSWDLVTYGDYLELIRAANHSMGKITSE